MVEQLIYENSFNKTIYKKYSYRFVSIRMAAIDVPSNTLLSLKLLNTSYLLHI